MFLSENDAENEARGLVPDLFLFCEKALNEVKASALQFCSLISLYFDSPQLGIQ